MDWDENKKDRLYALLCGKLEEIRDGLPPASASQNYFLVRDRFCEFLNSCGAEMVRFKKSRKIAPHWTSPDGNPVEMEKSVVVPDPFFALEFHEKIDRRPARNHENKKHGLCVPKETAERMLVLGPP